MSAQNTPTPPATEADPLDVAPPGFTMHKASTFPEFSGELAAPPSLPSRSRASSTSSFVSARVDFPSLEDGTDAQDPRKCPQWLTDAREKACKMYMQTTHSQTRLARLRSRRQPIESESDGDAEGDGDLSDAASDVAVYDDDDNDDILDAASSAEIHAFTNSPRIRELLDKLAALMVDSDATDATDSTIPAIPDWRQPAQLEAFLGRCLQGWESHAALTDAHRQMQKHVQQSRRAVDRMQKRIHDLEAQNAMLLWFTHHLQGSSADGLSLPTSATSAASTSASPASPLSPSTLPALSICTSVTSITSATSPSSLNSPTSPSLTSPTSPASSASTALLEEAREAAMKAAAAAFEAYMAKHAQ